MKRMERLGSTPKDFGLRVRSHPDTLTVTAANKLGRSAGLTWKVDLSNKFLKSTHLRRDAESLKTNRALGLSLAASILKEQKPEKLKGNYLFRDVDVNLIKEFLSGFRNSEYRITSDPGLMLDYIRPRESGELMLWDVLFTGIEQKKKDIEVFAIADGLYINCQQRTPDINSASDVLIHKKQRIASRPIEDIGLEPRIKEEAIREFESDPQNEGKQMPDWAFREKRTKPLLIVHYIQYVEDTSGKGPKLKHESEFPVLAWSISLPPTKLPQTTVEYRINAIYGKMATQFEIDTDDDYPADDDGSE